MCTHQRLIKNKYTGSTFLVKCGKCKSCLQEKAYMRAFRIKCEVDSDYLCLFVTLTYDRSSCPFVLKSDIEARKDILPVYREYKTRRVRRVLCDGSEVYLDKRYMIPTKLTDIYFPNYDSFDYMKKIRSLAYRNDHIGVCLFSDVQLFKKRLNINLRRKYNYEKDYKVFATTEYGETTGRPHAHLLFFVRKDDEALFRTSISEAWPFADKRRTKKYIQVARDAANYVASYVNSGANLHGFLSSNFKTKHSYSKNFGMADKCFTLDSVLHKIDERNLGYTRAIGQKGKEQYIDFLIPKYVVNRYFPVFKGYSRFTDSEVLDVLRSFIKSRDSGTRTPLINLDKLLSIDYSKDDIKKISVRLTNAYKYYLSIKSLADSESAVEDYIYYFYNCWKVYKNTGLKFWYENREDISPLYMFDNINEFYTGFLDVSKDFSDYMFSQPAVKISNPNAFPQVMNRTLKYEQIYDFRCKERKINNYVMAQNNYYF